MIAFTLLATLLSPLATGDSQEAAPVEQALVAPEPGNNTGKAAIAEIRQKYEKGEYDAFLKEIDASYQKVHAEGKLAPLAEFRQGPFQDAQWFEKVQVMIQERNQALLAAVEGQNTPFAEHVRSIASHPASEGEAHALILLSQLRQMVPGSGKNSEENALIDLDLQYEYKAIHLDMPVVNGKIDPQAREKQIALSMEKSDKMRTLAQSFSDSEWKKAIDLTSRNLDERLAAMYDRAEIDPLVKGQIKTTDPVVQKVAIILNAHQDKMDEMTTAYLEKIQSDVS